MCTVAIAVGATIGAATSAITGNDPLMGAVLGGATAGLFPAPAGAGIPGFDPFTSGMMSNVGGYFGASTVYSSALGMSAAQAVGMGVTGLAGGMAMNMLTPQQQSYNQNLTGMPYTPQAYNTQHATVTGSGGRQAAAVLASEIKQAKSLRKRQAEVADYGLGMDMAGTGLQIAA